ncbi:MAG TPA: acyltransferase, partial [Acidimicrobiales bacterium]|nr:acyltransferase [Acidimicrobiales bacterium]
GRAQRYPLFDVIRIVAALMVVFSHAFTTTGVHEPQPVHLGRLGVTWGHIGVAIFFVTSGFLVTESWRRRPGAGGYLRKRLLRIWPAFLVVLALCVFLMGPLVTDRSLHAYATSPQTWRYLLHNAVMSPIVFLLPGVFRHQPLSGVNGSLWTLPYEVLAYVALLGLAVSRLLRAWVLALLLVVGLVFYEHSVAYRAWPLAVHVNGLWLYDFVRLEVWFVAGALLALLKGRVVGNHLLAAVAFAAAGLGVGTHQAALAIPAGALLVIYLGTLPCRPAEVLHRLGDPSYGMYLSGFVFQQLLVWAGLTRLNPWLSFAEGAVLAALFGFASWHLVEKRAMRLAVPRREGPSTPPRESRELVGAAG